MAKKEKKWDLKYYLAMRLGTFNEIMHNTGHTSLSQGFFLSKKITVGTGKSIFLNTEYQTNL
jgi:hypothetical protein